MSGKEILKKISELADLIPGDKSFDRHIENLSHLRESVFVFFDLDWEDEEVGE